MPNSSDNNKTNFQAEAHLEQRDGVKYLPLKWRLAWLRAEYPQAVVSTRLVSHQDGLAVFQARIKLPAGGGATGYGAKLRTDGENDQNDPDLLYITEAEDQALGRALTVLGYGTEYALDFDTPVEHESIALNVVSFPEVAAPPSDPAPLAREIAVPPPTTLRTTNVEETKTNYQPEIEPEAEPVENGEAEEDADEAEPTPLPTNIRSVTGRQPATPPSVRTPAPVTPLPAIGAAPRNASEAARRPVAPVTAAAGGANTGVGNPAVNERLRGIEDSRLKLLIKQIYAEARRIYDLDENKVDQRSIRSYGRAANELTAEEAEEFLERIKNNPRRNQ